MHRPRGCVNRGLRSGTRIRHLAQHGLQETRGNLLAGRVTEYFNADYVQIPVLLSVDLIRGPNNPRPRFFLGPTVGLNVSARWKYDSEEVDPALFQETQGDLDHVKSLEVGLLLGGGIDFRAGAHVLQLQIRYEVGLTDAFGTARNRGLTLMTGYSF